MRTPDEMHGNAALGLNQRRRMVRRVIEQRWSITMAAAAAEVRTAARKQFKPS
jgi:hypothetical protein